MRKFFNLIVIVFLSSLILVSCEASTEQLAQEVRKSMEEKLKERGGDITITSFVLTKKEGNEYNGILETNEPNGQFTYKVEVIYDGKTFTWEILN